MGENVEQGVIDLDFSALTMEPVAVYELGREDIVENRPGKILLAEVKQFQAEGGFAELRNAREKELAEERAKDAVVGKREFKDVNIPVQAGDARKASMEKDTDD